LNLNNVVEEESIVVMRWGGGPPHDASMGAVIEDDGIDVVDVFLYENENNGEPQGR